MNVEEFNQLLAYHEVFGKLQTEMVANGSQGTGKNCGESGSGVTAAQASAILNTPGTHPCDVCGKIFPYRYQLIVHRRYHTERKPFTCQVVIFSFSVETLLYDSFLAFNSLIYGHFMLNSVQV